mgnify:FL=1
MATQHIVGRVVNVKRSSYDLFNALSNIRNFEHYIPADKREMVTIGEDYATVTYQGVELGAKLVEKVPFSRIVIGDLDGKPFPFTFAIIMEEQFDGTTNVHLELDAELNVMMKMLLGNKLQGVIEKITDQLEAAANGQMPIM